MVTLSVKFNYKPLKKRIIAEMQKVLDKKVNNKKRSEVFEQRIWEIIKQFIENSAAWKSLQDFSNFNSLASHFGFTPEEAKERLDDILDIWKDQVNVKVVHKKFQKTSKIQIKIEAIKYDYQRVLSDPAGYYYSGEHKIPWLQWLLFEKGSNPSYAMIPMQAKPVYTVNYFKGPSGEDLFNKQKTGTYYSLYKATSRSGLSIMYKIPDKTKFKPWKMPYPYDSGTKDGNFLADIFFTQEFKDIIFREVTVYLGQLEDA